MALSEASLEAGCMEFVPGSHRWGQLRHGPDAVPGSINAGSQAISVPIDTTTAMYAPIKTGEVSLHHTLTAHNSPPNRSNDRRIGYGISYIQTRLRHSGTERMTATLVRGVDRYGHFDLEPDCRTLSPEARIEAHHRAYARYNSCYAEQMARSQRAVA